MAENFLLKVTKTKQKTRKPSTRRVFSEESSETPHRFEKDLDECGKKPTAIKRRSSRSSSKLSRDSQPRPGVRLEGAGVLPGKSLWESLCELPGKVQSHIVGRPSNAPETDRVRDRGRQLHV